MKPTPPATPIPGLLQSAEARENGLVPIVTFDAVRDMLSDTCRRHVSASDLVEIKEMVRLWVRAAYSDAAGVAWDEMIAKPTDNWQWGYRSCSSKVADRLLERANKPAPTPTPIMQTPEQVRENS